MVPTARVQVSQMDFAIADAIDELTLGSRNGVDRFHHQNTQIV